MSKRVLTLVIVVTMGYVYSSLNQYFIPDISERPYVYRQLVPILSWAIQNFVHVSFDTSVRIVLLFSFVGMEEALRYFYNGFLKDDIRTEFYIILASSLVILIGIYPTHTYDIPTVALFMYALSLLYRAKLIAFFLLFPIICLNRETAFLLILCFVVYTWKSLPHYQIFLLTSLGGIIYLSIRMVLEFIYGNYPGYDMRINISKNLEIFSHPYVIISHIIIILALVSMVQSKWIIVPSLIKDALLIFAPIIFIAYLVIGLAMEVRVFLEIVPLLTFIGVQEPPWMTRVSGVLRQNDNQSIRK